MLEERTNLLNRTATLIKWEGSSLSSEFRGLERLMGFRSNEDSELLSSQFVS